MEFFVDFKVNVPTGTPKSEVKDREKAEASATAELADEGHLVRLWRRTVTSAIARSSACSAPTAKPSSTA